MKLFLEAPYFKIVTISIHLLLTVSLVDATSCSRRWCQYSVPQCLNETSALTRWSSESLHGCVFKASSEPDDLMLQWNKQTGVCSLFRYQHVCRMMQASGAKPIAHGGGAAAVSPEAVQSQLCSVYRALSFASCDASLSAHLIGVWLAGGRHRFSNLVCQSDGDTATAGEHRLENANLQWTEEGARFDGESSYALLNDSRFVSSDTSAGLTWLMRLKREPRVQPFLAVVSCSSFSDIGPFFVEFSAANQLHFGSGNRLAQKVTLSSSLNILPHNSSSWINIAVTIGADALNSQLFVGSSFDYNSTKNIGASFNPLSCPLFLVGRYEAASVNYTLLGTVSAIGVANSSMSEQQIRDFFGLLP